MSALEPQAWHLCFLTMKGKHIKKPKPHIGYRDVFGAREPSKGPLVLADCTSVEWPRGWSQTDADVWRKANRIERP